MATDYYVDVTNGSDANPGTKGSPWQTITYGQSSAQGVLGDRLLLRAGVYTEDLSAVTLTVPLIAYDEDVTIDASSRATAIMGFGMSPGVLSLRGIKIVNYTSKPFPCSATTMSMDNIFLKPAQRTGSMAFYSMAGGNFALTLTNVTAVGHADCFSNWGGGPTDGGGSIRNCIFYDNTTLGLTLNGDAAVTYCAYPSATGTTNVDTGSVSPGFVNASGGNYALAANSDLRGAGYQGTNIGATFQPAFRVGTGLFQDFSDWENDPLWWDTTLNGGAGGAGTDAIAAGAANPGPVIYSGGKWQIDTGSVPGATSGRVRSPVWAFGSTLVIKAVGWGAEEDETQAVDSKLVIDNSPGDATREIEIRGAVGSFVKGDPSPSWSAASKATALNLSAAYGQARMLLITYGK